MTFLRSSSWTSLPPVMVAHSISETFNGRAPSMSSSWGNLLHLRTKRAAFAAWEAYLAILMDYEAGRIPNPELIGL